MATDRSVLSPADRLETETELAQARSDHARYTSRLRYLELTHASQTHQDKLAYQIAALAKWIRRYEERLAA